MIEVLTYLSALNKYDLLFKYLILAVPSDKKHTNQNNSVLLSFLEVKKITVNTYLQLLYFQVATETFEVQPLNIWPFVVGNHGRIILSPN